MWNCSQCGAPNAENAAFCVYCGSEREEGTVRADYGVRHEEPPVKKSRTGLWIGIIAGVTALILALAAFVVFWLAPRLRDSSAGSGKRERSSASDDEDDESSSSRKSNLLGGDEGEWLLLRSAEYDDGELSYQLEYQYGKYGCVDYASVYYYRYSGGSSRYHSSYEYDGKGNQIKTISYNGDTGEAEQYTLFEYNRRGNRVKASTYSYADDELLEYTLYEYGLNDEFAGSKTYDADGGLTAYSVRTANGKGYTVDSFVIQNGEEILDHHGEYDRDDHVLLSQSYEDGSLRSSYSYEYDGKGNEIAYAGTFWENGKVDFTVKGVMEYDSSGNRIREVATFDDDWDSVDEYSYDAYGNAILEVNTLDGRPGTVRKNEYVFYQNGVEKDHSGSVD